MQLPNNNMVQFIQDGTGSNLAFTGWDVRKASKIGSVLAGWSGGCVDIWVSPDGKTLYTLEQTSINGVSLITMSIPFDITSAVWSSFIDLSAELPVPPYFPAGFSFSNDGFEFFVAVGNSTTSDRMLFRYTLTTAYDLSTRTFITSVILFNSGVNALGGVFFREDGLMFYVTDNQSSVLGEVRQYSLTVAWDITTFSLVNTLNVTSKGTSCLGIYFNPIGTRFFIIENQFNNILQYTLGVAWDITSSVWEYSMPIGALGLSVPTGIYFTPNGRNIYASQLNLNSQQVQMINR